MAYFLDLFSPETYEAFASSSRDVSGFRPRQGNAANRIKKGDKLVCYMTKLSRWCGILEVVDGPYHDDTPRFYLENDPFTVRFKVKPIVWLPKEKAVPIHESEVWNALSFTRGQDKRSSTWTGKIRASLTQLEQADGLFLERLLTDQDAGTRTFEVDEAAYGRLVRHRVRTPEKAVTVTVPEESPPEALSETEVEFEVRESVRIQALIARIGAEMGLKIWLPRNDRAQALREWHAKPGQLLDLLPLNYDEATLRTIEQIDVLWLRRRSIVRAFEIEHTTSIYSGLLRMADLLALQPNMDIRLHIVAPPERRDKVFQEITRPVFSLLDRGPLADSCTYISYDSVRELAGHPHLAHLSDTVLEELAEEVE